MGLLDFFSKDARALANSKREYDDCQKFRRNTLRLFRVNAMRYFAESYPLARVVANSFDNRFMALLQDEGLLLIGRFADSYFPVLEYVSDDASIEDRSAAVAQFRNEIEKSRGYISRKSHERLDRVAPFVGDSAVRSFRTNGFAVSGSCELRFLVGGALFLNRRIIARSHIWDEKRAGYFSERIFAEIKSSNNSLTGTQVLTFVTCDEHWGGGEKMIYEIRFDRSLQYFDKDNRREFVQNIADLEHFMLGIEGYFHSEGLFDRENLDCLSTDCISDLENPDPPENRSVESRDLL